MTAAIINELRTLGALIAGQPLLPGDYVLPVDLLPPAADRPPAKPPAPADDWALLSAMARGG